MPRMRSGADSDARRVRQPEPRAAGTAPGVRVAPGANRTLDRTAYPAPEKLTSSPRLKPGDSFRKRRMPATENELG
jgi:hypothetical protein